jgi:hypothetical protein
MFYVRAGRLMVMAKDNKRTTVCSHFALISESHFTTKADRRQKADRMIQHVTYITSIYLLYIRMAPHPTDHNYNQGRHELTAASGRDHWPIAAVFNTCYVHHLNIPVLYKDGASSDGITITTKEGMN